MTADPIEGIDGRRQYVSAGSIVQITPAGESSRWHGIQSFVRLFDGRTIESRDTADGLAAAHAAAQRASIQDEDCTP